MGGGGGGNDTDELHSMHTALFSLYITSVTDSIAGSRGRFKVSVGNTFTRQQCCTGQVYSAD